MVKVEGKRAVSMNINPHIWKQAHLRAAEEETTVTEIVEKSLEHFAKCRA